MRLHCPFALSLVFCFGLIGESSLCGEPFNRLTPIDAYDPDGYDQAVFQSLIGKTRADLWMVCKPSFASEYAVILRSEFLPGQDPFSQDTRKWTLEYAKAAQPIWHWEEYPEGYSGSRKLDLRKNAVVVRRQIEIPASFATALLPAWSSVLRLTDYSNEGAGVMDGVTYQFSSEGRYFGETWSSETGLPADIVSLAQRLIQLVESPPDERSAIIKDCEAKAKILEEAARKESVIKAR